MIIDNLVSVIMANYNTPESYLREAIESILKQTYSFFEFIIIDDCSTNNSISVIESYHDDRIKLFRNKKNIGLTKSLNLALNKCLGEYIARMDSDDISLPTRFEKQINFLKNNKKVIVCGTWASFSGQWEKIHSNQKSCRVIPRSDIYRIFLLFGNNPNIIHPTAMFSHRKLNEKKITYHEEYTYAQDYRMWVSCSEFYECANVEEILLNYRVHDSAISSNKKEMQNKCVEAIIQEQLSKLHLELSDTIKPFHINLLSNRGVPFDLVIKQWFSNIIEANKKYHVYNQRLLKKILLKKWTEICYNAMSDKSNWKQVFFNLSIRCYPYVLQIYLQRKKGKTNG